MAAFAVDAGIRDLHRVASRALEEQLAVLRESGVDVLKLEGGPRLALSEPLLHAAATAMANPAPQASRGKPELRHAIAGCLLESTGVAVDPETEVLVTSGAMHALNLVVRSLARNREVIVPTPNFFFDGVVRLAHGQPRFVAAAEENGWRWDLDAIEAAITPSTGAILLSNPVNPTGFVPSRDEMAHLCAIAERQGVLLISDESYDRFVYDGASFSSGVASELHPNVVVIKSLSKGYALAPWRIGYIVAARELVAEFMKILEWECLYVADVAQAVAAAAIEASQEWFDGVLDRYSRSRGMVRDAIDTSSSLSAVTPLGATFFFLNLGRDPGRTVDQLMSLGVPVVGGRYFGAPSHARLPFGGPDEVITKLVDRIAYV